MPVDSYPNCRFYVEIDGMAQAVFTEVSGLQLEMEVMEYQEGGNNDFVHRLPGRTKSSRSCPPDKWSPYQGSRCPSCTGAARRPDCRILWTAPS